MYATWLLERIGDSYHSLCIPCPGLVKKMILVHPDRADRARELGRERCASYMAHEEDRRFLPFVSYLMRWHGALSEVFRITCEFSTLLRALLLGGPFVGNCLHQNSVLAFFHECRRSSAPLRAGA